MLRVLAPHFCAGIEFRNDVVIKAAPILSWSVGKERHELERYFERKGWKAEPLSMTTHLMVDIETLGTRPGAIIISAAFVRCADEANFVLNLSIPEQQALGMEIDPATHAWWGEQETKCPGIWQRVTENPQSLNVALPYISTWLQWAAGGSDDWLIWCHGATFDCPLLDELYRRVRLPSPWKYWQVRDTRTLYDLASINPKNFAVPPPHVALNDALGQSRALMASLAVIAKAHQGAAA